MNLRTRPFTAAPIAALALPLALESGCTEVGALGEEPDPCADCARGGADPELRGNQPDLDVFYIERRPRLELDPSDPTRSSGLPEIGDEVRYVAHVKSFHAQPVRLYYVWLLDGEVLRRGRTRIDPGARLEIELPLTWDGESRDLEFRADPFDRVPEVSEMNNRVEIRTDALRVGLWVERSLYDYFREHQHELGAGSNSFEDWGQRMMRRWNRMFAEARYPQTPEGVLDRVALDKVTVVPDGALPLQNDGLPGNHPDTSDLTVDLMWGFPWNPADTEPGAAWEVHPGGPFFLDYGAIHEMHHARWHIDTYGMDVAQLADPPGIQIRNDEGELVAGSEDMPFVAWNIVHSNKWRDLMGAGPEILRAYSAATWNQKHHRRGPGNHHPPDDIGAFLQDLPERNRVCFIDQLGVPLAGALVRLYQADPYPVPVWYGKLFQGADAAYFADAEGCVDVGNNPFGRGPIVHTYGHSNATLAFEVNDAGERYFGFLEVTDFNLAYWQGEEEQATHVRQIDRRGRPSVRDDAWIASYHRGEFDERVTSRFRDEIDLSWDPPPSVLRGEPFSIYWVADLKFTEGWKELTLETDGGVRVYLDGRLVLDDWDGEGLRELSASVYTEAFAPIANPGEGEADGRHRVEVRYRTSGDGGARVRFDWKDREPEGPAPIGRWRADYFSTPELEGYVLSREEAEVAHEFGLGAPDPSFPRVDDWSARWVGTWRFEEGTYRFRVEGARDGARIWIDGELVRDAWSGGSPAVELTRRMSPGHHRVRLDYRHRSGPASARVHWERQRD